MELNYSLQLNDNYIRPVEKVTADLIKKALTINASCTDRSSTLAITRLLEIIGSYQRRNYRRKNRSLTPTLAGVLEKLAALFLANYQQRNSFNRNEFMNNKASCNDFSILKHWGFIQKGAKVGEWSITNLGLFWVVGRPGSRYCWQSVVQLGGNKKDNYCFDTKSRSVTFADVMGRKACLNRKMFTEYLNWVLAN